MFNHDLLKAKIQRIAGTPEEFIKRYARLHMSARSLRRKLNGESDFTCREIEELVLWLGLDSDDIPAYFFDEGVKGND